MLNLLGFKVIRKCRVQLESTTDIWIFFKHSALLLHVSLESIKSLKSLKSLRSLKSIRSLRSLETFLHCIPLITS